MREADGFFVLSRRAAGHGFGFFYYSYLSFLAKRDFSWMPDDFPGMP